MDLIISKNLNSLFKLTFAFSSKNKKVVIVEMPMSMNASYQNSLNSVSASQQILLKFTVVVSV